MQKYKESGSFQREFKNFEKKKEINQEKLCLGSTISNANPEIVEIQDVFFPIQLLFVGIFLGILILIFEKMYFALKHRHEIHNYFSRKIMQY